MQAAASAFHDYPKEQTGGSVPFRGRALSRGLQAAAVTASNSSL